MKRKCLECPAEFEVPTAPSRRDRKKFCSKSCANAGNAKLSAKKRGDAQRGRGQGKAYTKLYGRHEHRVVMENKIGRLLRSSEIVHHIDGNKKNNAVENLVITNRKDHGKHHGTKYSEKCLVDRCPGAHYQKGHCMKHFYQIKRNGKIHEQDDYNERAPRFRKIT